ncbi:hypothetical protein [Aminobacter sp. HY435]|uniref:hypothetical protein n=1 Tax=Aminobacter sp. HY435 TaxID=2970917 RepID=UPI0022B98DF3|nr:hypothetical protein [Aminobacter sp. HY435]
MHRVQLFKTLVALAAAGFNPRAFLAPMALGGKLPEPDRERPPKVPEKPDSQP